MFGSEGFHASFVLSILFKTFKISHLIVSLLIDILQDTYQSSLLEEHTQFWGVSDGVKKRIVTLENTLKFNFFPKTYENHLVRAEDKKPSENREEKFKIDLTCFVIIDILDSKI